MKARRIGDGKRGTPRASAGGAAASRGAASVREATRAQSAMHSWVIGAALALVPVLLGLSWVLEDVARQGRIAFPMDDPYIHFQFARNLARGDGFAFNPGEPTPGATSPLWVVLLAIGCVLRVTPEVAGLVLGLGAAAATTWLTWSVGRRVGLATPWAVLAALGTGLSGRFAWASLSGMETGLAAAMALAVIRVQLSAPAGLGRAALTGLLAGLAAQSRPEMMLLAPLAAVTEWRATPPPGAAGSRPARLAALLAAFVAVAAPYVLFCLATTGRPFPNTFYAKSLVPLAGADLPALRAAYLPGLATWIWRDNALFALLVLPGIVVWRRVARPPGAWLVLLWPLAFCLYALVLYPRHFSLSRYTIPLLPCIALLAAAPLELVARRTGAAGRRALIGVACAIALASAIREVPRAHLVYRANVANILRMHVAMSAWIGAHLPPSSRIAMNDVGAITYYSGRYCIDTVGLVSGDLIGDLLAWPRTRGAPRAEDVLPAYLARTRPDHAVLFPAWYPTMTRAPWLREIHRISYPNSTGGGDDLVVYEVTGTPAGTPGAAPTPARAP